MSCPDFEHRIKDLHAANLQSAIEVATENVVTMIHNMVSIIETLDAERAADKREITRLTAALAARESRP